MRRAVWFEPAIPGVGLRAVEVGAARWLLGRLGMQRILYRDFDGECRFLNVWPAQLIARHFP